MKDCEVQLNVARLEEQRRRAEQEAAKSRSLNTQVTTFTQTERELRDQLSIYVEKFKQVSLGLPRCNPGAFLGLIRAFLNILVDFVPLIINKSVVVKTNLP